MCQIRDVMYKDSLQLRQARSRVLMLYRVRYGLVAIPASVHLQPVAAHTRGSGTRYRQLQCRTNTYSQTFFPSTICLWNTTCRCLPATAGQLQGSTEHYPADVNGSGVVFNPPRSTAPFLSVTIVLSTILHRCSTSHTCTLIAVQYYSISELAPCWKKKKLRCDTVLYYCLYADFR